jgi:hypothetical protein
VVNINGHTGDWQLMNKNVSIAVESTMNQDYEVVCSKITDITFYSIWWKKFSVHVNDQTKTITFRPFRLIKIKIKVLEITDHTVLFQYTNFFLKGAGLWEVCKLNFEKTKIRYTVNLYSNWKIFQLLLNLHYFARKHRRDILGLIKEL